MMASKNRGALGALMMLSICAVAAVQAAAPESNRDSAPGAATQLPERLTRTEVRDVVARLSDDEVRDLLISQLDKVAIGEDEVTPEEGTLEELKVAGERAGARLSVALTAAGALSGLPGRFWESLTASGETGAGWLALTLVLAFAVGYAAEWLFRHTMRSVGRPEPGRAQSPPLARAGLLAVRAVVDLVAILIAFLVATGIAYLLLAGNDAASTALVTLIGLVAATRAVAAVSRAVLAPHVAWLRLLPLSDAGARGIHARVVVFALLWFGSGSVSPLVADLGLREPEEMLLRIIVAATFVLALMIMALEARNPVAAYIRGGHDGDDAPDRFREILAKNWHVFTVAYLAALYLLATATVLATGRDVSDAALASLALLVAVPVIDTGLRMLCARWFRSQEQPSPATGVDADTESPEQMGQVRAPVAQAGAVAYERAMLRNLRIVLGLVVLWSLAGLWNLDLVVLAEAVVGDRLAGSLFEITITLILAYAVWSVVKASVERVVGPEAAEGPGESEMGGAGATRIATLLPLLRKFVLITLLVMVAMIVLSSLGVNIGPLLAGAGMLGLAVGFGAQTLVKDVLSGMFFLLDDAFRMGEYIDLGDTKGTVEKISVRSMQLRHQNGPLNTVPFGEIRFLKNYSRDWAIMKFELRLPFETDIDKVRKIIKKVGQQMQADPALGPLLLEPLKSQGVNRMDDSALIVRCKFTAVPGEQFILRREAYMRIQRALAEAGIHFAPRRVLVETTEGSRPAAAAAAAAGALDSPTEPASEAAAGPGS